MRLRTVAVIAALMACCVSSGCDGKPDTRSAAEKEKAMQENAEAGREITEQWLQQQKQP
jgi:hypothetical protein